MWTPDHAQHFSMLESEPPADPDAMDAAVAVIFPLPPLICAAAAAADTESVAGDHAPGRGAARVDGSSAQLLWSAAVGEMDDGKERSV